jgi:membrane-bound serine protease (ClpP class)
MSWLFICLIGGLLLVLAEVFVPGGVLGAVGTVLLLGGVVAAYFVFDDRPHIAVIITLAAFIITPLLLAAMLRYFPGSRFGREMVLSGNQRGYTAVEDGLEAMLGKEGVARSNLRPAGIATIDGRRTDVVTEGMHIEAGTPIVVVDVEANRVVVRKKPA